MTRPHRLYVGTIGEGVFRSADGGESFRRARDGMPFVECHVRALALHPGQPEVILAGTSPAKIFRSADGGRTWEQCATRMVQDCPRILHTRVTCILADPADPGHLWAGVEIDGLHESRDGGRTWEPLGTGL